MIHDNFTIGHGDLVERAAFEGGMVGQGKVVHRDGFKNCPIGTGSTISNSLYGPPTCQPHSAVVLPLCVKLSGNSDSHSLPRNMNNIASI